VAIKHTLAAVPLRKTCNLGRISATYSDRLTLRKTEHLFYLPLVVYLMTLFVEPELCSQYSDWCSAWTIRSSNTVSGKVFVSSLKRPDRLWGPVSRLCNWYKSISGGGGHGGVGTSHLHLSPSLRMSGSYLRSPCTPSWCGQAQNCEEGLLASPCLSAWYKLVCHWMDFHEIWCIEQFFLIFGGNSGLIKIRQE